MLLTRLARAYLYSKPDTSLLLCEQGLSLSQQAKFTKGEALCLEGVADAFDNLGNYPKSLENYLMCLKIYETANDVKGIRRCLGALGSVYAEQGEYRHVERRHSHIGAAPHIDPRQQRHVEVRPYQ